MSTPGDILPLGPLVWEAVPTELLRRVARFCAEEGLLDGVRRLLVACSGGADSLALLALLAHPSFAYAVGLDSPPELIVGHVDHRLRPGSGEDAAAVARLAEGLGLQAVAESLSWPGGLSDQGIADRGLRATEGEAREARLGALDRLAEDVGADGIAFGHTASDQLETLIMRLLRGSGIRGLAGMAPRRGHLVRPLLGLSGVETRALVTALGWRPREDPSNASEIYLRNRIRHHVVPLLVAENPRAAQAAFRTASVLREELQTLDAIEAATWEQLGTMAPGGPSVSVEAMRGLSAGLAARILRRMWRVVGREVEGIEAMPDEAVPGEAVPGEAMPDEAVPGEAVPDEAVSGEAMPGAEGSCREGELGREHVAQILALLAREEGSSRVDLPGGVVALRTYGHLVLCARRRVEDPGDVDVAVPGPGIYTLDALGLTLEVLDTSAEALLDCGPAGREGEDARGGESDPRPPPLSQELLLDHLGEPGHWPLRVRNSRPGDRVRVSAGHKKVSDLMVDCKVPVLLRRRTPILVEGEEILWIPGLYRLGGSAAGLRVRGLSERTEEAPVGLTTYRLVFRWGGLARATACRGSHDQG